MLIISRNYFLEWYHDIRILLEFSGQKSLQKMSLKKEMEVIISNGLIKSKEKVTVKRIYIDQNLHFDCHVNNICKKASKKLQAQ